nr:M24 family metallopeptidase [Sulfolobus acidocaldarius]
MCIRDSSNLLIQKFSERGVKPSFEPIITSGPNTSMPHLRATNRKVARNEVIIFDFGIRYKGYATDTTRVVSIGKPNEDVLKIHEIVREAQERAEEYVSEKVETSEVDKIARQTISKYGFGAYFIHRTGHGIGIDVHEDPYISSDYKRPIKNNMTFTIEPGIYLPGKFGIRIEDMVFVNDKGISMNKLDKNIFTL